MKTIAERRKKQAGLSLIELVVVSSILSVFSIFMVNLLMVTQNALSIQRTGTPVRTEAKLAMEYMAKELREADLSAPDLDGDGTVIDIDQNGSQITFLKPNQVTQAGVISWRCVQFSLAQQQVNRIEDNATCTAASTVIGRNVNSLQFARTNNDVITVTVGTTLTGRMGTMQSTLTSQIKLRN